MAVKRIWHGWTTPENADAYEATLTNLVEPMIKAKAMPGYLGMELLRRVETVGPDGAPEVEFITVMTFETLEHVKAFTGADGGDYTAAHVPDAAQKVLKRFDTNAQHYEVKREF